MSDSNNDSIDKFCEGIDSTNMAAFLSTNKSLYEPVISYLSALIANGIVNDEVKQVVQALKNQTEKALEMMIEGQYYAFEVYDSWAEEQTGNSNGILLYQKIGDELIRIIGLTSDGPYPIEDSIDYLEEQGVNVVYTGNIATSFMGVEATTYGDDGSIIDRKIVDFYKDVFEAVGIKVVELNLCR